MNSKDMMVAGTDERTNAANIRANIATSIADMQKQFDVVQAVVLALAPLDKKKITVRFKSAIDTPGHNVSYYKENDFLGWITLSIWSDKLRYDSRISLRLGDKKSGDTFDYNAFCNGQCKHYLELPSKIRKLKELLEDGKQIEVMCHHYNEALAKIKIAKQEFVDYDISYYAFR